MKRFYYTVGSKASRNRFIGPTIDIPDDFDFLAGFLLVRIAAEDYFLKHSGWSESWPLPFIIYKTKTGPEIFRWTMILPKFKASS